jgi:hypothetical protein
VESTRIIVLDLFPANERGNLSVLGLAERVGSFTDAKTLRTRLDAFVELFNWLRVSDRRIPEPLPRDPQARKRSEAQWKRERVWLSVLEASPEVRERYRAAIATILDETDAVALFAESGLPNDRGLVPETIDRLFRIVLPAPREETDLARLFVRLFPTQKEVDRFFGLPSEVSDRIVLLASPEEGSPAWHKPVAALLDAFCLLGARVQGLGLSEKLRTRSQCARVQESAFYRLPRAGDALVEALRKNEDVPAAAMVWKSTVGECRAELANIVDHLNTRGVNLDIVYALDVIEKSLTRMEIISGLLVAQPGQPKVVTGQRLMKEVIRGRVGDRSLLNLAQNSFRLLARKIIEWAGKTGEHYITSSRDEYARLADGGNRGNQIDGDTPRLAAICRRFSRRAELCCQLCADAELSPGAGDQAALDDRSDAGANHSPLPRCLEERRIGGLCRAHHPIPARCGFGKHRGGQRGRDRVQHALEVGDGRTISFRGNSGVCGDIAESFAQRNNFLRHAHRRDFVALQPGGRLD